MRPETKRQRVEEIWGLSGEALVPTTPYLEDQYLRGVGHPGTAYLTGIPNEFGFALDVVRRWKERPAGERLLGQTDNDAWNFAAWLGGIPGADRRPMRNALLYFLFPDQFERNVSSPQRTEVYTALRSTLPPEQRPTDAEPSPLDLDKAIYAIRGLLEQRLAKREIDFYLPPLYKMWNIGDREKRRKQLASALERVLSNYNLDLHQVGSKKKLLQDTRPTSEATGYWADANDATNKPLRWLMHIDLTGEHVVAHVPDQHGSRHIAYMNTAQGKSGAVLVRIIPAMRVAPDRYEFFETWEWLLLFCFLPSLPAGSGAQLIDDFDPESGSLSYKRRRHPYIFAALVALNDADASFTTAVNGATKTITYIEATTALAALLHIDLQPSVAQEAVVA